VSNNEDFVSEIMGSPAFKEKLAALVVETGSSESDVKSEAVASLHELAAEQSKLAINSWDKLARWFGRAYRLDVDEEQIVKLKELNEKFTLVFLPNHRSYLDPLVLRSALHGHGFAPNHTLGGLNLAFWPMGTIARRNGTVFIRREFKDAPVYKATLKEYIAYLIRHKQNLEWYIEGGRTRTGKLRPPRMGILSYVVDAFDDNVTPPDDVLLIPVFVGYDQQYEVGAISHEELGGKKSPESVGWLFKFAKAQKNRRGRAHLRFGEPLSLREALTENRAGNDDRSARLAVPKIAFEVSHRINQVTPIMPSALVTFALLDNDGRAMTVDEGRAVIDPLMAYIMRRGIDISSEMDFEGEGLLHQTLRTLTREGVVTRYDGGLEPIYNIAEDRQHEAAFYRNTLIHYFITRSLVEVALVRAVQERPERLVNFVWEEAKRLRDVLKYEFFFPRTKEFAVEVAQEAALAYPGWEDEHFDADQVFALMKESRLLLAHRVLGPFLESYGILADRLAAHPVDQEIDREKLILECIGVGQQRWLQSELHSPESISRDLFAGAYQLADNRELITAGTPELEAKRQAFASEFTDAIARVDIIRDLAQDKEGF